MRTLSYRRVLVRYIDLNPCSARLVEAPTMYKWGSARHYARDSGPPWLERGWVESEVARECEATRFRPELYDVRTSKQCVLELTQLVEARMRHVDDFDPWDEIVSASNPATRKWMIRKAILADGTRPGLPLLAISRLDKIIEETRGHERWVVRRGKSDRDGWAVAYVALGRDLCGQTLRAIAERLGFSETKVRRLYATHRAELRERAAYSLRVAELADAEFQNQGGVRPSSRPAVRR
ncbi:MAG: hypothetical protein ACI835_005758 [Planctomycetota bacterium]